tara:strand:+ start:5152 stop:5517 length:366 start_codon:yes stop_codon:yes gene_type:complete
MHVFNENPLRRVFLCLEKHMQETNSREVVFGELSIICRELTVLQVRGWMEALDAGVTDTLSGALFKDCSFDELKRMTTLTDDQLNSLRPSQIEQVIGVCKELNPHFFALLGRVAAVVQAKQ